MVYYTDWFHLSTSRISPPVRRRTAYFAQHAPPKLEVALDDWSQPYAGFHLYYPSRKQASPAFSLVVDALRYGARR